jgi:hypothetical protein
MKKVKAKAIDVIFNIKVVIIHLLCLAFLLSSYNYARSYNAITGDSTGCPNSYSFQIIFGISPELSTFSKLGIKSPSYRRPTIFGEGNSDFLGGSFELGLGHRNTKMIFRMGPLGKTMASTSADEYAESDSLKLSDQYHLVRQGIELSHAWYHNKSITNRLGLEITPMVGYDWCMRKYNGKVQDLKNNQNVFDYRDRTVSKGITFGGQATVIYLLGEKERRSQRANFNYIEDEGIFFSFLYKHTNDIQQFTAEVGWLSVDSAKRIKLQHIKFFGGIDEFRGDLKGRVYKIGFIAAITPKRYLKEP